MSRSSRLSLDVLAADPDWGPAFRREFDLVVAANVVAAMQGGPGLYQDDLARRVADFCAPLDKGLKEEFLGVIDIPPNEDAPYKREDEAVAFLKERPRGTWAIFHKDGGYDAYMADGMGGVSRDTGHKFSHTSPRAPRLTFANAYASLLGTAVYERRGQIEKDVLTASFKAADLKPGLTVRNEYLVGKRWDRIEFLGMKQGHFVGGGDIALVRMARRGVKAQEGTVEPQGFVRLFNLPIVMPEAYADDNNAARLESLPERRGRAAQAAYEALVAEAAPDNLSRRGSGAPFKAEGDVYVRDVYVVEDGADVPGGTVSVTFAPGTDEVVDRELALGDAPRLGM